jgi:sodium/hydrogen antiporter
MDHGVNISAVAVVAGCFVLWALVSARLERLQITAPMAFVALGVIATHGPTALVHLQLQSSTIRDVAELTLALVLFSDACRVNAQALKADRVLPSRLLGVGLPLTIGAGVALAVGLFSSSGIWVAAAIGAIVAPTDAALGSSILTDARIPERVRRVLNVESGLNDGIATPFVNLFLAGALASESIRSVGVARSAAELIGGAVLGGAVGLVGAVLLTLSTRAGWSAPAFRPLLVLSLALFAFETALVAHSNGFIAAFVAGIAFGTARDPDEDELSFSEEAGTLLSLLVWFSFGAVMLVPGFQAASWSDVLFAVLALTVVRMAPVAIALTGTGLDRATVAFIGWFGPRGLASVVFGLLAADTLEPAEARVVLSAVVVTVAMSVVAHGASASPFARRYGRHIHRLRPENPEHHRVPTLPIRTLSAKVRGDS